MDATVPMVVPTIRRARGNAIIIRIRKGTERRRFITFAVVAGLLVPGHLVGLDVDDVLDVTLLFEDVLEHLHGLVGFRILSADIDLFEGPSELGSHLRPLGGDGLDELLDDGHVVLDVLLDEGFVALGPILHVDREQGSAHVPVYLLGDVGDIGCHGDRGLHDRVVQGTVGCDLVVLGLLVLGPAAVPDELCEGKSDLYSEG